MHGNEHKEKGSVHEGQKPVVGCEQRHDTKIDKDIGGLDHLSIVGAQVRFDGYEQGAASESYCSRPSEWREVSEKRERRTLDILSVKAMIM